MAVRVVSPKVYLTPKLLSMRRLMPATEDYLVPMTDLMARTRIHKMRNNPIYLLDFCSRYRSGSKWQDELIVPGDDARG